MNMVDTRCFAKSAPALLVGASMEFRGASVINAIKIDTGDISFYRWYFLGANQQRAVAIGHWCHVI